MTSFVASFCPNTALTVAQALAATTTTPKIAPNTHTLHTYTPSSPAAGSTPYQHIEYLLYLPTSYTTDGPPLPILLFLHGADEVNKGKVLCRSKGRRTLINDGAWRLRTVKGMLPSLVDQIEDAAAAATPHHSASFPFILVSPQCPQKVRFSSTDLMDDLVRIVQTEISPKYNGDLSNVFVTGLSMGGCGTWSIASRHATFFKAAAPICGGFSGFQESILQLQGLWCFHGANDTVIPVNQSDVAIRQLKKALAMKNLFGLGLEDLLCTTSSGSSANGQETKGADNNARVAQQQQQQQQQRPPIDIRYTRYERSPSPAKNMQGHGSWIQAYYESDLLEWLYNMSVVKSTKGTNSTHTKGLATSLGHHSFQFLSSEELMQHLLPFTNIDASELLAALRAFHQSWDFCEPQRSLENDTQLYPYKGTLVSYYNIETGASKRSAAHNHPDYPNWVIEHVDATTSTTGQAAPTLGRRHRQFPSNVDTNPIVRAMHCFLGALLSTLEASGEIEASGENNTTDVWEALQCAFRVTKTDTINGQPGPEGVHQDDCILTVVILLGRTNIQRTTGSNRIWSLEQKAGTPTEQDINDATKLLKTNTLLDIGDAVFLLDRKVKHEACPIEVLQGASEGVRDVLTFEVRRKKTRVK